MIDVILFKEISQSLVKFCRRVKIPAGQHMSPCVFPESLDDIEVRGIRREEHEVDSEIGGLFQNRLAMLVTGIVKDNGDRKCTGFLPHLSEERLYLLCVDIDHRMGLDEVKGKRIDTSEEVEPVTSGSGLEIKGFPAPYMTCGCLRCEVYGVHEIEPAPTLACLFYNRLDFSHPFLLLLRRRLPGNWLHPYETQSATTHDLTCPCQPYGLAAEAADGVVGLSRTTRGSGQQPVGNSLEVFLQSAGTTRFRRNPENGVNASVVISMDQVIDKVTAAPCGGRYSLTAEPWFGHLRHEGSAAFADDAAGIGFVFLFETGIRLLAIYDGEQSCKDNVNDVCVLSINGVRRLLLSVNAMLILHKYFMFYL